MIEEGIKVLGKVVELDVNDVLPNRFQPRIKFSEDSINELADSIKEHGVIQPIVVRPMGDKYEIIAGERRYKACLLAGKQTIKAIITDLNDKDSAEVALIENVQRKDLTPIEEAISYKKILDMGYLTQDELASKLGKNQSTVANKLRLLNLAEEVQEAVLEEKISERHARSLLKLKDQNQQLELLNKIIENRLTVRKTDEEISKLLNGTKEPVVEEIEEPIIIIDEPTKGNDILDTLKGNTMIEDTFDPFKMEEPVENKVESLDFAIPTAPIEDIAPVAYPNPVEINPGFMDINKIENNAQDINVEKPEVDLNSLLMPTDVAPIEEVTPVEVAPVEAPKEEVSTNKFFDFSFMDGNKDNNPTSAPVETSTPNVSSESSDVFSFDFNSLANPTTPVSSEGPSMTFDENISVAPVIPEVKIEEPKEFSSFDYDLDDNSSSSSPIETVKIEDQIKPIENNNISESINPMPVFTMPAMDEPRYNSEDIPVPTVPVVATAKPNNIMEALNIVRNCSKELEKLGYVVDMEEID
ncbi:MAG TPA: ParB/RepB/Spo0J family partition protein, partial [Bacilli bacterium]|nr:ParB/RepB/Spo0J family partition protein [Bacilli bacterium]